LLFLLLFARLIRSLTSARGAWFAFADAIGQVIGVGLALAYFGLPIGSAAQAEGDTQLVQVVQLIEANSESCGGGISGNCSGIRASRFASCLFTARSVSVRGSRGWRSR